MAAYHDTTWMMLHFIRRWFTERPYAPTLRECAEGVFLTSASTASRHIKKLDNWGYITHEPGIARSIALTDSGKTVRIPPQFHLP